TTCPQQRRKRAPSSRHPRFLAMLATSVAGGGEIGDGAEVVIKLGLVRIADLLRHPGPAVGLRGARRTASSCADSASSWRPTPLAPDGPAWPDSYGFGVEDQEGYEAE